MREIVTAKGNIDHLLGATGGRADKEQARSGRFRNLTYGTLCPKENGFGEAPQQAFSRGSGPRENGKCVHTCPACQTVLTRKWALFR